MQFAIPLLGVLFVGLKLTDYIDWSWWLVLLPFYGGLAVVLGVVALVGIGSAGVLGSIGCSEALSKRKRRK